MTKKPRIVESTAEIILTQEDAEAYLASEDGQESMRIWREQMQWIETHPIDHTPPPSGAGRRVLFWNIKCDW